jgi:hypothetical protein
MITMTDGWRASTGRPWAATPLRGLACPVLHLRPSWFCTTAPRSRGCRDVFTQAHSPLRWHQHDGHGKGELAGTVTGTVTAGSGDYQHHSDSAVPAARLLAARRRRRPRFRWREAGACNESKISLRRSFCGGKPGARSSLILCATAQQRRHREMSGRRMSGVTPVRCVLAAPRPTRPSAAARERILLSLERLQSPSRWPVGLRSRCRVPMATANSSLASAASPLSPRQSSNRCETPCLPGRAAWSSEHRPILRSACTKPHRVVSLRARGAGTVHRTSREG